MELALNPITKEQNRYGLHKKQYGLHTHLHLASRKNYSCKRWRKYGKTTTYGEIASRIAKDMGSKKMSAQAVGGAVSHNPIALIIPCHRVVGADGSLTGYAGGIERKQKLLELEHADILAK